VDLHAVRALHNEQIGLLLGPFGRHEVAIVLHAVISRVKDAATSNVDPEHAGAQDVTGVEGVKGQTGPQSDNRVEVDQLDLVNAGLQFGFRVQHVFVFGVFHLQQAQIVSEQEPQDRLGGVRHEDASPKARALRKVRQRGGVIEVKVRHETHVNLVQFDAIQKRETIQAVV